MEVKKICSLGYFDRLILDGYMMPMYNSKGIEIKDNESLIDALESSRHTYSQKIGKLRINIIGETSNNETYEEIIRMREHREKDLKLTRDKLGTTDRYTIGYIDILILKSNYSFINSEDKEKIEQDIFKFSKTDDQSKLVLKAAEIQQELISKNSEITDIAIVDRVYVNREFRGYKLSTWIHTNIGDIIKIYSMIDVSRVLLIPGDFSNEAYSEFGMDKAEYMEMLTKHYKKVGYRNIGNIIMCKKITSNKKIKRTKNNKLFK